LRELCAFPEVVAVGECGLDFDRNFSPREDQLRCFEAQLELAAERRLPVFLHERAAHEAFFEVIRRHRPRLSAAVVHCFTGDERALGRYLDLDLHIGFTGWLTDARRGEHLLPLARRVPATRLMLETDAPYILPKNMRPSPRDRRNEPAFLGHVLEAVAAARGEPPAEVAANTTRTARAFFGLEGAPPR
jgi:TatD DNase family protein